MADMMVTDIARGYVNTGVFPRGDVYPVTRIAKGDSRVPGARIWGRKEQY